MTLLRSFTLMALINVAALVALLSSFWILEDYEAEIGAKHEMRYEAERLATSLRHEANILTQLARIYASTGEEGYLDQYNTLLDIHLGLLERPEKSHRVQWDLQPFTEDVLIWGDELLSLEQLIRQRDYTDVEKEFFLLAVRLMSERTKLDMSVFQDLKSLKQDMSVDTFAQADWAKLDFSKRYQSIVNRLYNERYHQLSIKIKEPIDEFQQEIEARTIAEVEAFYEQTAYQRIITYSVVALLLLTFVSSFYFIYHRIIRSARRLSRAVLKLAMGDTELSIPHLDHSL